MSETAEQPDAPAEAAPESFPENCMAVVSPVTGSIWRTSCIEGQTVKAGDTLFLVESMKMEIPVLAPVDGIVTELRSADGRSVSFGQALAVLSRGTGRATANG